MCSNVDYIDGICHRSTREWNECLLSEDDDCNRFSSARPASFVHPSEKTGGGFLPVKSISADAGRDG